MSSYAPALNIVDDSTFAVALHARRADGIALASSTDKITNLEPFKESSCAEVIAELWPYVGWCTRNDIYHSWYIVRHSKINDLQ